MLLDVWRGLATVVAFSFRLEKQSPDVLEEAVSEGPYPPWPPPTLRKQIRIAFGGFCCGPGSRSDSGSCRILASGSCRILASAVIPAPTALLAPGHGHAPILGKRGQYIVGDIFRVSANIKQLQSYCHYASSPELGTKFFPEEGQLCCALLACLNLWIQLMCNCLWDLAYMFVHFWDRFEGAFLGTLAASRVSTIRMLWAMCRFSCSDLERIPKRAQFTGFKLAPWLLPDHMRYPAHSHTYTAAEVWRRFFLIPRHGMLGLICAIFTALAFEYWILQYLCRPSLQPLVWIYAFR